MAVRSVRSYRSILHAAYNEAIINGIVTSNPLDTVVVHGKKNREYNEEYYFLTEEENSDVIHFMSKNYPNLVGITFMGAYYGLRRSEIPGLKWDAIDWERKTISIQHTVVRVTSVMAEDTTRTQAGARVLNLFVTAQKCLKRMKQEQDTNRNFFGNTYANQAGYIFTWEDGRQYDPDYIPLCSQRQWLTLAGRRSRCIICGIRAVPC